MSVRNMLTVVFDYAYTLLATPWLLIHFVWDLLLCLPPWTRPGKAWTVNQAVRMRVVKLVLHYWSLTRAGDRLHLRPGSERNRFEPISPKPSKLYQGALFDPEIKPAAIGLTWTPARPPPAALIKPSLTLCLHFHGGGFAIGNGRDTDTGYLCKTLLRRMGCTHVCTPQYRLSSTRDGGGRFPVPIQDALTSYLHLTRDRGIPAGNIILSGDSAGANIALGLLRYIHEHGSELDIPAPGAVALWSPWVHVGAAINQDMRRSPNYRTDYLNKEFGTWGAKSVSGSLAVDPEGPYLSPLNHPFKLKEDIPMFVHGGNAEVLWDDIRAFSEIYGGLGWNVHLAVADDAPHDILLLGPLIGFGRQASEGAAEAGKFFARTTEMELRVKPGA